MDALVNINCHELLKKHQFDEVARNLDGLLARHESGFLELGESLQGIAGSSRELASSAAGLAELMSGHELEASTAEMTSELETMRGLVERCAGNLGLQSLGEMLERINDVRKQVPSFRRIVKTLQMLGISTRIESSRLGGASGRGFATLADDIENLAVNIVKHIEAILRNADELEDHLGSAMQSVQAIQEDQKAKAEQGIERIEGNLQAMVSLAGHSQQLSEGLPAKTRSIDQSVGAVVTSLQFHDIVRQQVEHISEAMMETHALAERVCCALDPNDPTPQNNAESEMEVLAWVADICRLQQPQLANAGKTLVDAVERLSSNLQCVSDHVRDLSNDIGSIIQAESTSEDDLLNQIEKDVADVAQTMHDYAKQNRKVAEYMQRVAQTVGHMASFVEDIEEVGSEIELLALNASVKAAHTGDQGRALGVLAMAVQRLAGDAREQTSAVSHTLSNIGELSSRLTSASNSAELDDDVDRLVQQLDKNSLSVRDVSSRVEQSFNDMAERSDILIGGIRRLTGSINVHELLSAELEEARERLGKLEEELKGIVPEGMSEHHSQRLQELLSRYTMEAERSVHLAALGMNMGPAPAEEEKMDVELFGDDGICDPEAQGSGHQADMEFDDNIELF